VGVKGGPHVVERQAVEELVPLGREAGVPQRAHVGGQDVDARLGGVKEFCQAILGEVFRP